MNEREETAERSLAVEHISKADLIINTAQMRDAAVLDAFRWKPDGLDTSAIVQGAAEKAFSERQKQKKSAEAEATEQEELTSLSLSIEPAQKRPRLDLPTSSTGESNPSALSVSHTQVPRAFHFSNTFQSSFQSHN